MAKKKKQPAMRLLADWSEKVQENEAVFQEKVKATVKRQQSRKQQRKTAAAAWGAASGAYSPERGGLRLQVDGSSDAEQDEEEEQEGGGPVEVSRQCRVLGAACFAAPGSCQLVQTVYCLPYTP